MTDQPDPSTTRPSQKGWISVDFDKRFWVPCPPVFAPGADRERWASAYARACWENSGLKHGKRQVSALAQSLASIHESVYATLPCHLALIHVRDPRVVALPVCFGVWQAAGSRQEQIRALAGADATGTMEPPVVTEFPTADLGDGLKMLCYFRDKGTVTASLGYAWRSDEFETAVRLFTACPDLGRLEGAMADIDELARRIRVIPRP